jgi:hypothetical protein
MQLMQILGMAAYEFRMHWRRRILPVATLSLIGLNLVILLVLGNAMDRYLGSNGALDPTASRNIVPYFWIPIYFVLLVLFGPIMAEVIPLDHNVGIRELLDSLPLNHGAYLVGKLLGMFFALLMGLVIAALALGIAARLVLGQYNILLYIQMWLIGVIPIALLNPGLSLLLAAGQPTRRRAAAVGGGFAILCMVLFVLSTKGMLAGDYNNILLDSLNPARPAIMRFFIPAGTNGVTISMVSNTAGNEVALALLSGTAELLVAGSVMWWWLHWRESRA